MTYHLPAYCDIVAPGSSLEVVGFRASGGLRADGDVLVDSRKSSGWTSAALFGAVGDGVTDDAPALRAALAASNRVFVPRGTYRLSGTVDLSGGQEVSGAGPSDTTFLKDDFQGAAFRGLDADDVRLRDFAVRGPGRTTGTGNKGVVITTVSNPIVLNSALERVRVSELDDVCVYLGSAYGARLDNVTCKQYGYCGIFLQGGDGSTLRSCSTLFGLVGFRVEALTTMTLAACYAEQNGTGFELTGCRCLALHACGVEAPITFDSTFRGVSYLVDGGGAVHLQACLSRQDTSGNPVNVPHLQVTGGAAQVRVTGFHRINHATSPTGVEADLSGAAPDLVTDQTNLDPAKVVGGPQ